MMIGHHARDPASVFCPPQDTVEVWEVLKEVIPFLRPVAQSPVPHLRALEEGWRKEMWAILALT